MATSRNERKMEDNDWPQRPTPAMSSKKTREFNNMSKTADCLIYWRQGADVMKGAGLRHPFPYRNQKSVRRPGTDRVDQWVIFPEWCHCFQFHAVL